MPNSRESCIPFHPGSTSAAETVVFAFLNPHPVAAVALSREQHPDLRTRDWGVNPETVRVFEARDTLARRSPGQELVRIPAMIWNQWRVDVLLISEREGRFRNCASWRSDASAAQFDLSDGGTSR